MKIGVSTYSFHRYITEGRYDLFRVIRKAREMGFRGIEFFDGHLLGAGEDRATLAGRLREACASEGLPVVAYVAGADFIAPRAGGDWRDEATRLEGEVRLAAALGAPCMRHDAARAGVRGSAESDFTAALPIIARGCRAVAEFASSLGVRTMVENHGFFVQESARCARLVEEVNHPSFGALVDIGNFLCADDEPPGAVTRMARYAVHCHAKDFHRKPADAADPGKGWFRSRGAAFLRGAIVGHGVVDVPACIRALRESGYTGFVSIEFEGMEDNAEALEIGLANLRRYMEEAGCLDA